MRQKNFLLVLILALLATGVQASSRVAVLPFKMGRVDRWWSWNWNVNQGIEDLVVGELVRQGDFQVVERERLEAVLGEQRLGRLGMLDPKTVAEAGRILGVDYLLLGTITDFTIDDGGLRVPFLGRFTKTTATVSLEGRLVDTQSAVIVAAVGGRGEESQTGFSLGRVFGSLQGLAFDSQRFQNHILGKATGEAVGEFVTQLSGELRKLKPRTVSALVADVAAGQIILNAGADRGVFVGQSFTIQKKTREITDPATGEIIWVERETVAQATVTEVTQKAAMANLTKIIGNVEVGQEAIPD